MMAWGVESILLLLRLPILPLLLLLLLLLLLDTLWYSSHRSTELKTERAELCRVWSLGREGLLGGGGGGRGGGKD